MRRFTFRQCCRKNCEKSKKASSSEISDGRRFLHWCICGCNYDQAGLTLVLLQQLQIRVSSSWVHQWLQL